LWHRSPRQKPSRGRRGGGGGSHDDFPGVEISIAGGVEEMVRGSGDYKDLFSYRLYVISTSFNYLKIHNCNKANSKLIVAKHVHFRVMSWKCYQN